MEEKLKKLLKQEKEYRDRKNSDDCFKTCLKIIDLIQSKNENNKFDIISKLFLYPNQSNYVKLLLINSIIQNSSIINNKSTKRKYYQLLIDSFSKTKNKEYQQEINQIKQLYDKSELNNFLEIDKYIENIASELLNKLSTNRSTDILNTVDSANTSMNGDSTLMNLAFKSSILDDGIISDRNENLNEQATFSKINLDVNKKNNDIRNLIKKYRPNNQLPMIIISVSVNLNSNQFLDLINENFGKYNYKKICTIKDSELENIRVYEFHSKNCINNIFSKIFCKNKNSINQFQIITTLKRDENNFNRGINSFLNDIYERKISIKTIKGNQENAIKAIVLILKYFCLSVDRIQVIKQSKCFLKYNLDETLKKIINNHKNKIYNKRQKKDNNENGLNKRNSSNNLIEITLVEKTNNDASKYYEMYKIFSKNEYGLGKTISEFIENFKDEYKLPDNDNNEKKISVNNIDTKSIMMKIINIIEVSINTLNTTFNYDEDNLTYNDPTFFANASENFILNKIYPTLYNIYNLKYKNDNEAYLQKKKEINDKLSIDEICNKIDMKKKFRGNEKIPFKYVIDIINKINYEKSLKKKFETITQASLELRNCILDYTNCKYELDSMDDELPIIIYIVTQINVDNLFAELYMIDDYIKCSLRDKLVQNKMVTNLLSSLLYVSKDWKFEN